MYIVYGGFCIVGFVSWLRLERNQRAVGHPDGLADPVVETVG
jgi:nicotinamide mononucleotide transporter